MSYKLIITLLEISRIWNKSEKFSRARLFKCWIYFIYFILFATLITKNIGKEEEKKKEVARRPNRTIGAYERLGLLEL